MAYPVKSPTGGYERWFPRSEHPVLYGAFSSRQREELFADDLLAGRTVPLVLASVIVVGLVLAVITVLATL